MPIFAILVVVIAAFAGLAMDFSRTSNIKSRITSAIDAANLAAARTAASLAEANPDMDKTLAIAQAEEVGRKYLASNLAEFGASALESFALSVRYDGGLWFAKTQYEASIDATLTSILGASVIKVAGTAEASVTPGFPVLDIAMCIDSTGSMTPTLEAVKANALSFFDNLNIALE